METFFNSIGELSADMIGRLIAAAVLFFAGRFLIGLLSRHMLQSRLFDKIDGSVRTFMQSFIRIALYALLIISIISLLGVPMASIITVLASASVAVGLALQGALTNLAGGIILIIFKPFELGDFIESAGVKGTVKEVSLLYTVLTTVDNRRVHIPNGTLMNATITNYSSEPTLRIAIEVTCSREENPSHINTLLQSVLASEKGLLEMPAPSAWLSGSTDNALTFTACAWVNSTDYWPVLYRLNEAIAAALQQANVKFPATCIHTEP